MKRALIGLFALLMAAPALAQPAPSNDATAYRAAYQFVARERWGEALTAMRAFVQAHPQSRHADEAAFWTCFSLERLPGRRPEAAPCYDTFPQRFPQSPWRDDAQARRLQLASQGAQAPVATAVGSNLYEYQAGLFEHQATVADQQEAIAQLQGQLFSTVGDDHVLHATRREASMEELAVQALARPGQDTAVDDLRRLATEHTSAAVREAAVGGLARIGTPRAHQALVAVVSALLEQCTTGNVEAGRAAAAAVQQSARSGSDALTPLLARYVRNTQVPRELRWQLVSALRRIGTPDARAQLWALAESAGGEAPLRTEALRGLGTGLTRGDVTRMGGLLRREPDAQIRRAMVEALSRAANGGTWFHAPMPFGTTMYSTDSAGVMRPMELYEMALSEMDAVRAGDKPPPAMANGVAVAPVASVASVAPVAPGQRGNAQREAAREDQRAVAEEARRVLEAHLDSEPAAEVQRAIVVALATSGNDAATSVLARIALDGSKDEGVAAAALDGLGRIGTEDAHAGLRGALTRLESPRLLATALRAITARTSFRVRAEAVPEIARLTAHADPTVRRAAVDALGRLDSPDAQQALLSLIRTPRR